jgi:hypothetical protein
VLDGLLWALCEDLLARGELGLDETFIEVSFSGAKRGAIALVQRAAEKGARSWQSQTAMVFLSRCGLTSASPNESTLVEDTLDQRHISPLPERMIGDRAYDSDRLDDRLQDKGVELIAPTVVDASEPRTADPCGGIFDGGRSSGCLPG